MSLSGPAMKGKSQDDQNPTENIGYGKTGILSQSKTKPQMPLPIRNPILLLFTTFYSLLEEKYRR